jgi:hypothetical protein
MNCFSHPAVSVGLGFLITFAAFYSLGRYNLRGGGSYHFDPGGKAGEFEPHSKRYQDIARLVITLSTASAAFVFNFLINIPAKGSDRNPYSFLIEGAAKVSIASFAVSVICLLTFMILQTYLYEVYSHNQAAYTAHRYAASMSFGFTGLVWFLAGYGWLAWALFSR